MYEAIQWPREMAPSRSPIHFTNELEVAASPETIWDLLTDPAAWPSFYPGVQHVRLLEGHTRFGAGTRASQVTSRRKEVERLQTTELARSNIQRPYIRFPINRPSGRTVLECEGVAKAYGKLSVIDGFSAIVSRGERIVLTGRNGSRLAG